MQKKATTALAVLTTLALGLTLMLASRPVAAASVDPIFVDGNPTCESLGYAYGFKPQAGGGDATESGTYSNGFFTVEMTVETGPSISWDTGTFGIDAVIIKGGSNANLYEYDSEATSDTGLTTPTNPQNGKPFGLSHVEFCYDFEVVVTKTADTTFTRTYNWTIDKSVTPDTLHMFRGDSGDVEYTVAVTKDAGSDSDWAVSGSIFVFNPAPTPAAITGVTDEISGGIGAAVDCGVTFPYALGAGQTLECTYSSALPDGAARTNTATATTTGGVGGDSGSAAVAFGDPTTKVNDTINVDDTNGGTWPFSDSGSVSYPATFTCDADEGIHDNTATIGETGQADSASVTVSCYELEVTKSADTSYTRTWTWAIEKVGDQTALTLSTGQSFLVNYDVTVDATSADSDHAVSGTIAVYNPAPVDATLNGVADVVSSDIAAAVDCGVIFPHSLAAGGTLDCTYSADLPDASERTNTATATLQNTPSGTTDFTGSTGVSFADATVAKVDECVDVSDTLGGALGSVCAGEAPKTFEYSYLVGPYDVCGGYAVDNTASFTAPSGAAGSASWTVNVDVPCVGGCTLTQGYWKTHSEFGPAPYDETWALLPSGASTTFFLSGKSWYDVFWTPPAGNAYYNLAHQYMAARLNVLNGADPTAISSTLTAAESLLGQYTPAQVSKMKGNDAVRKEFATLAATLDKYNNGLIGPGHCDE